MHKIPVIRNRWIRIGTFALASVLFLFSFGNFLQSNQKAAADCPFSFVKISSYTTYFSSEDRGRLENIRLASKSIHGITIQAYGEFSFNQWVGKRTKEKGYETAKIIVGGEYVEGVGGGVCQVSTTLYNAALKSGLTVTEFHPHSLRVGYVSPSRDAMVSEGSDLRLFNPHAFPVFLETILEKGSLKITFYGQKVGYRYEITSKIVEELSPPEPLVKEGMEERVERLAQAGIRSEAYLETYLGNVLCARKLLRRDCYRPIQGIIVKKMQD